MLLSLNKRGMPLAKVDPAFRRNMLQNGLAARPRAIPPRCCTSTVGSGLRSGSRRCPNTT